MMSPKIKIKLSLLVFGSLYFGEYKRAEPLLSIDILSISR